MNPNKRKNNIFERNPRITTIVILFIAITVIDITVANIVKVFLGYSFHQRAQQEAMHIEKTYRISSNIYHHDLKKNTFVKDAIWANRKYTISTNSLGFKSKYVINTPLSSHNYRIVFIGDSFTEGIGVEYQNTFVGIISEQLSSEKIEVLNASVVSYSPIIYWRKIKYLIEDIGLKFDELVVFIDISDIEDEALHYKLSENNTVDEVKVEVKTKKKRFLKFLIKNTILINYVLDKINNYIYSPYDKINAVNMRRRWTIQDDALFKEYGKKGLDKAACYMGLLYDLLIENDIKLIIAVYPWPEQIINNDLNSIQVIFWEDWAKQRNVRFLNYFPRFIKLKNHEKDNKLVIDTFFIQGDVHLNEKGHQLFAETFLSFYRDISNQPY